MIKYQLKFVSGKETEPLARTDAARMAMDCAAQQAMVETLRKARVRSPSAVDDIPMPNPADIDLAEMTLLLDGHPLINVDLKAGTITANEEVLYCDPEKNERRFILQDRVIQQVLISAEGGRADPQYALRFPFLGFQWTREGANHKVIVLYDDYLHDMQIFEDSEPHVRLLTPPADKPNMDMNPALQVYFSLHRAKQSEGGAVG